jgi:hypothetical protein
VGHACGVAVAAVEHVEEVGGADRDGDRVDLSRVTTQEGDRRVELGPVNSSCNARPSSVKKQLPLIIVAVEVAGHE